MSPATDAYTKGPWPQVQSELTHRPHFNVATQLLMSQVSTSILPERQRQGVTDTRTVLSSVRLDHSGRLIVGSIGALRGSGAKIHTAWAKRAIRKLFPQIGDFDLDYAWHGSIGMTDTRLAKFSPARTSGPEHQRLTQRIGGSMGTVHFLRGRCPSGRFCGCESVGQPTIGCYGRPIGEYIVVTCYLRYVLDPFKLKEFEIYGKMWIPLVEKFGGKHHGYFMPSEGISNVALALFTFPSLAAYEVYRTKAAQGPDCQAAMRYYEETKCFLSFERSFFRPVFS